MHMTDNLKNSELAHLQVDDNLKISLFHLCSKRLEISLALVISFNWKLRYVQDPDGIDASLNQVV